MSDAAPSPSCSGSCSSPAIEQAASGDDAPASVDRPRHILRAAKAVRSLATMLCGAGILITAAMLLDASTLQARSLPGPDNSATRDAHQELARSLAAMLGQCQSVLAINPARGSGSNGSGAEIVLWLQDTHDPGLINADELAVVRHSPLFQTITLYSASDSTSRSRAAGVSPVTGRQEPKAESQGRVMSLADLAAPGAVDRWRAHPAIAAKVLATGVSSMVIEPLYAKAAAGFEPLAVGRQSRANSQQRLPGTLSPFRLRLTWGADSSDGGADSASAVVEATPFANHRAWGPQQQQEYQP